MSVIIFTGLEGMLLSLTDAEYQTVATSIERLQQLNIPLIPVTERTRVEVRDLLSKIGLTTPFVVERGSGIFISENDTSFATEETEKIADYRLYQLGCTYTVARAALKAVQEDISKILRGFGDMDESDIQSLLESSLTTARQAKAREFSEYFLTPNRLAIEQLQEVATEFGFEIVPGDKLSLILGAGANPSAALTWLKNNYQGMSEGKITTVGLGSTVEDLPWLETVDLPIVIPKLDRVDSALAKKQWQTVESSGLPGWLEAIDYICDRFFKP